MITIQLTYVAMLREQAGTAEECVATAVATCRELFTECAARHGFTVHPDSLRVAVNDRITSWDQSLVDGDRVLFLPPASGG